MPKSTKALNPTVHYVELELAGKTYHLAFDFNAIATAEQVSGLKLLNVWFFQEPPGAGELRGLLYAALLKAHPDMTLLQVGKLMQLEGLNKLPEIMRALGKARDASMPAADPQKPESGEATTPAE